jgi:coenzyme F420-0:L-glutamate ligase / coenzyme F420-1:gamma-L-glutamate ligase
MAAPGDEPLADLRLFGLPGLPEIQPGDDLAGLILGALGSLALRDGDVLVVAQKVVSKAEGRLLPLHEVEPSAFASSVAEAYGKDPRHVEVILRESRRVVRMDRGLIICETRHGFICANAGVDLSNVPGDHVACLLPLDPDASAAALRQATLDRASVDVGVIISDTFGRPWREGVVNVAIGIAGLNPLQTFIGKTDPYGYELQTTVIAPADELASAAELVMGKLEQVPVVLVRGYAREPGEGSARMLVRAPGMDLFR